MTVHNLFTRLFKASPPAGTPSPGAATMTPEAIEQVMDVLATVEDADLVLKKLGLKRHDLRRLETDDEIFQALETRRDAVVGTPWRLDPYDTPEHEWLWRELEPHIHTLVPGIWGAVPYGYSVVETVYTPQSVIDPKRIGIASAIEKPMEWFSPRYDGTMITMIPNQTKAEGDTFYKYILTQRNAKYNNPFGESLLSRAYWPWMFRTNGWKFWMSFLNRHADPLIAGSVADPSAWVDTMKKLGYEALIGVNTDEKVEAKILTSNSVFPDLEQAVTRRIQKLILGQTLTSDIGSSGSYAAAKVHNEVREDKLTADIRLVSQSVQHLINALWILNGLPDQPPSFVMSDDSGLEEQRAIRDERLTKAGIIKLTDQYILSKYDYEPGDFLIPAAAAAGAPGETAPAEGTRGLVAQGATQFARSVGQRFTADQQDVEHLADVSLSAANSPITASRIRELIDQAPDPETLITLLTQEALDADADEFRDLLERALFAADVLGYTNSAQGRGL